LRGPAKFDIRVSLMVRGWLCLVYWVEFRFCCCGAGEGSVVVRYCEVPSAFGLPLAVGPLSWRVRPIRAWRELAFLVYFVQRLGCRAFRELRVLNVRPFAPSIGNCVSGCVRAREVGQCVPF